MDSAATATTPAIKRGRGGFRPGAGRKPGTVGRSAHVTQWNARVGEIKKRLWQHAIGEVKLESTQVKASEVLLDRHEPRLSSVEAIQQDPRDLGTPAEFFNRVVAILAANPALHERLNREVLAAREQQLDGAEMGKALELVIMSNTSDVAREPQAQRVDADGATYPSTDGTASR